MIIRCSLPTIINTFSATSSRTDTSRFNSTLDITMESKRIKLSPPAELGRLQSDIAKDDDSNSSFHKAADAKEGGQGTDGAEVRQEERDLPTHAGTDQGGDGEECVSEDEDLSPLRNHGHIYKK